MACRARIIVVVAVALGCVACKGKRADEQRREAPETDIIDAARAASGTDASMPARDSELAHLRAWSGVPSKAALEAAAACDDGDAAGCYRLGNYYEEGMGTESDMARAHALHARACDAGRGEACRIMGMLLLYDSGPPADKALADRYMARACELDFLDACHMIGARLLTADPPRIADGVAQLVRGCVRGYEPACRALDSHRATIEGAGIAFPSVERLPLDQLPVPSPAAACPPMHHLTTSTGGGARLNPGLDQVPHETLLAALPAELPGWATVNRSSFPAGRAGTRASYAGLELSAGDASVSVSVMDNFMNCTLQPRTGEMGLSAPAVPDADKEAIDVAGRPAVLITTADHATVSLWLADRCTVTVSSTPAKPAADLVAVATEIDLDGLAKACAERTVGFGF